VHIYEYAASMLHSKTLVVDDNMAMIGTANFDYRSFFLNYEVCVIGWARAESGHRCPVRGRPGPGSNGAISQRKRSATTAGRFRGPIDIAAAVMSETVNHCVDALALWRLQDWLHAHPRVVVIGGAGCGTEVGIPDYRDRNGQWKRPQPVTYQAFMGDVLVRQRYWARSMLGWRVMGQARPGSAHQALARLEQQGRLELLITQNVDGLHDAAGSLNIVDLHGRIDTVRCMDCDKRSARADLQQRLLALNPAWAQLYATPAPDGDADLENQDFSRFVVPACPHCGTGLIQARCGVLWRDRAA
jgi:NAD-dependent SIR2 family protein deacetylase